MSIPHTTQTQGHFAQYLAHYLKPGGLVMMLLLAFVCIGISIGLIALASRIMSTKEKPQIRQNFFTDEIVSLTERLYELIFSSTFILLFVAIYFSIDYFGTGNMPQGFWDKYNGVILLFFILASVLLISLVDTHIISMEHVQAGERATMRLLGIFYMMVIFLWIKYVYNDANYDTIVMYFVTLIIGRFICFDSSIEDFRQPMSEAVKNLPLLALALMCTGIMALYGFSSEYLQKLNGVVLNLFIAQLFLLAAIFVIHHLSRRTGPFGRPLKSDEQNGAGSPDDSVE